MQEVKARLLRKLQSILFGEFECARQFAERYLGKRLEYPTRCSLILHVRRKFELQRGAFPE